MYPQYQKPKRCWKCGGNKIWMPELNKWKCPQCDRSSIPYTPQAFQQPYQQTYQYQTYQHQAYSPHQYPPQYGYQPYYQHPYHGPTTHYGGSPTQIYQQPYLPYQNFPPYQTSTMYAGMLPGNKICVYCGNLLREDQNICPKCMQYSP